MSSFYFVVYTVMSKAIGKDFGLQCTLKRSTQRYLVCLIENDYLKG